MSSLKKTSFLICLFLLLSSKIYASGAGAHIGIKNGGLIISLSGNYKMGRIPLVMGTSIEAGLSEEGKYLTGFSAFTDYWIFDLQLKNTWNFYTGLGANAGLLTSDFQDWNIFAGARFFSGMNWLFYDNASELFIQQNFVPTYQKAIKDSSDKALFTLLFPLEIGFRFHF